MYDFDRTGAMSFQEFVELNKFLLKVQQAFADLERGLGYLVPDEVYKGLVKIGISLDSPAFYRVCESFDQDRSGKFRLDDFIALCIFVQSARHLKGPFKEATVFLIGGGNYVEYGNLLELACRQQPVRHIIYGTTEILTGLPKRSEMKYC